MTTLLLIESRLQSNSNNWKKLSLFLRRRRTIKELNSLSNKQLDDIGIFRGEIESFVNQKVS